MPISKDLTELQEAAREGYLQRAMRGYILWLIKQTDKLPAQLHEMYIQYREMVRGMTQGTHDRAPESVACLLIGYSMMLYYMRDIGVFDQVTAARMMQEAQRILVEATRRQARDMQSQKEFADSELCRKQETRFPVTLKGLYKHLREDGICGDAVSDESVTRNKRIKGKAMRVLWIPRGKIDGEEGGQQLRLDEYEEVPDDDNPF